MAQIPSDKLIKKLQKQSKKEIRKKKLQYLLRGKRFHADAYGPGVVPKDEWENMKEKQS